MIASEKGGRGAEKHRGRSAFQDQQVKAAMGRLLALGETEAASTTTEVQGIDLHHLEAGAGDTLLLIHGAGGGAANWYAMMKDLAQSYHVVAVDLPGFGLSGSIQPQRPLGGQVASLLADWLGKVGIQPRYIVGTSFGGLTAARLAPLTQPERLVLIDAAGLWPEAGLGLRLACNRIIQSIPIKQSRRGTRFLLRRVMTTAKLQDEHEEAIADYLYWSNVRTHRGSMARAYTLFAGLRGQVEVLTEKELRELAPRTLILWGEHDTFLPATEARRQLALAAGAQLRIIPRVGHSPNWEAPGLVTAEVLSFLK